MLVLVHHEIFISPKGLIVVWMVWVDMMVVLDVHPTIVNWLWLIVVRLALTARITNNNRPTSVLQLSKTVVGLPKELLLGGKTWLWLVRQFSTTNRCITDLLMTVTILRCWQKKKKQLQVLNMCSLAIIRIRKSFNDVKVFQWIHVRWLAFDGSCAYVGVLMIWINLPKRCRFRHRNNFVDIPL